MMIILKNIFKYKLITFKIFYFIRKQRGFDKSFLASNREDLYSISKPIFEDFEKKKMVV